MRLCSTSSIRNLTMKTFVIALAYALLVASISAAPHQRKSRQADDILSGCGDVKGCWGHVLAERRDCDWQNEACDIVVTWLDNGDGTLTFEALVTDPDDLNEVPSPVTHWISVGFSTDDRMGDDTVLMSSLSFEPNTQLWYNTGHVKPTYVGNDEGIETIEVSADIAVIYASWTRPVSMSYVAPTTAGPVDVTNDLAAEPFFILAALGDLDDAGEPVEHEVAAASEQMFQFV